MKTRFMIGVVIAGAILFVRAGVAMATTNLFTPVTGSAFVPYGAQGANLIVHTAGLIYNSDTVNPRGVEASLGHAQGQAASFAVAVHGNGQSISCSVIAVRDFSNPQVQNTYVFTASSIVPDGVDRTITVPVNIPAGTYFLTMDCVLPKSGPSAAGVGGVTPSQ